VPPYSYNWSNGANTAAINNLAPGSYTVDVIDANGCSFSESIVINTVSCNTIVADVTINNETCVRANDGFLILNSISNGTVPYSILWSTGITGTVTNNLASGTYQLNIADNLGCPFEDSYTIESATDLSVNTYIADASSNGAGDGSIDLTVSGGLPPYTFYWSTSATTEDINGLTPGNYWVSVLDANNCQMLINNVVVGNNCPTNLIQQNYPVLITNVYQVAQFIQSNGIVNINEQVSFKAGDYIELTNDFEVKQGAEIEAKIEGCD